MTARVTTHAPKGARLLLNADGTSYTDLKTGYVYRLTLNELLRFVTFNNAPIKATFKSYVSKLPEYLGVKSTQATDAPEYPMTAYNNFAGRETDDATLKDGGLRQNAKPYYASIDCVIRFKLNAEEKSLLNIT